MKTKTVKVDGAFPDNRIGELLEDDWNIIDKTIIDERYIVYILSKEE